MLGEEGRMRPWKKEIRFRRRKFCLDYIQIRDIDVKEILD